MWTNGVRKTRGDTGSEESGRLSLAKLYNPSNALLLGDTPCETQMRGGVKDKEGLLLRSL